MHSDLWHRLDQYLLPCPFKWLTGMDCPGCGFQRSFLALLQGDFEGSFALYPTTIPLLVLFATVILHKWFGLDRRGVFLKGLALLTGGVMLVSYAVKIYAGEV